MSAADPPPETKSDETEATDPVAVPAEAAAPPEPPPPPIEIVLIGAGHTHLQLVRWWRWRALPRTRLTLVSAFDRATYSGMLPGIVSGQFRPTAASIDLNRLCRKCGVRLIVDRAVAMNPDERTITLAHQPTLTFAVASINLGSVPASERLWQTHRTLVSVKPMATFMDRLKIREAELIAQWRDAGSEGRLQFVVIGGGAAGVELALCLEERVHREELPWDVHLVDAGAEILSGASPACIDRTRKLLKFRGVDVHLKQRVVDCDEDGPPTLLFDSGERLRCDIGIWAAGASPPMVLRNFQLPLAKTGFLKVQATLQTTADAPIFAVGDVAEWSPPLPKAGVYAVRQARVLWHNVRALVTGGPLVPYEPQSDFLRLLNCGDGTAIVDYRGRSSRSRWAWWWKRWIDKRFVRRFR